MDKFICEGGEGVVREGGREIEEGVMEERWRRVWREGARVGGRKRER